VVLLKDVTDLNKRRAELSARLLDRLVKTSSIPPGCSNKDMDPIVDVDAPECLADIVAFPGRIMPTNYQEPPVISTITRSGTPEHTVYESTELFARMKIANLIVQDRFDAAYVLISKLPSSDHPFSQVYGALESTINGDPKQGSQIIIDFINGHSDADIVSANVFKYVVEELYCTGRKEYDCLLPDIEAVACKMLSCFGVDQNVDCKIRRTISGLNDAIGGNTEIALALVNTHP
jgi:hypothetical protein